MELSQQSCAACEGEMPELSHDEVRQMMSQVPGWELKDKSIERTFNVPDFVTAVGLANQITPVAEQENHHPDLHISYGKVRVELSTHKVGGLTKNDFLLAAKINQLWDKGEQQAI